MDRYKCAICKNPIEIDLNIPGIQCDKCGSRIFYKERPSGTKKIKTN
ncbi:MAG: DNA-directed RNA polymerase subunit P [Candidatus Thermoplasmatota archaeon]|nr:DNA-directed RNA polymerase subunit P [Candidatus Thermoplasmatota archaeon]MDI6887612.1 DNA-directed RNA polymerase subunit P [Candidatus Thermoplasmatota archaeon]